MTFVQTFALNSSDNSAVAGRRRCATLPLSELVSRVVHVDGETLLDVLQSKDSKRVHLPDQHVIAQLLADLCQRVCLHLVGRQPQETSPRIPHGFLDREDVLRGEIQSSTQKSGSRADALAAQLTHLIEAVSSLREQLDINAGFSASQIDAIPD